MHMLQDSCIIALINFVFSHCLEFNRVARSRLLGNPVLRCRKEQASIFWGVAESDIWKIRGRSTWKVSTLCVRIAGSGKLLLFCCFLFSQLWVSSQLLPVSPPPLPPQPPTLCSVVCSAPINSEAAVLQLVGLWNLVTGYSATRGVSKLVVKQRRNKLLPKSCRNGFLWNLLSFKLICRLLWYVPREGLLIRWVCKNHCVTLPLSSVCTERSQSHVCAEIQCVMVLEPLHKAKVMFPAI